MLLLFGFTAYAIGMSHVLYRDKMLRQTRGSRDTGFLLLTLGLLLLLNCLRGMSVGNDTYSYYRQFEFFANGNLLGVKDTEVRWMYTIEIGFRWFLKLAGLLTDEYQVFLSLTAVLLYAGVFRAIRKYSVTPALSVLVFFFFFFSAYLNLLRQAIAVTLVLLAYRDVEENRPFPFLAKILAAVLFHKSAAAALLLWFLPRIRPEKKILAASALLSVVLGPLHGLSRALTVLGFSSPYLEVAPGLSAWMNLIREGSLLALLLLLGGEDGGNEAPDEACPLRKKTADRLLAWLPWICLDLALVSTDIYVLNRFSLYFEIWYLFLLPYAFRRSRLPEKKKTLLLYALILLQLGYIGGTILLRPEWVTEFQYVFFWKDLPPEAFLSRIP